MTFNIIKGDVIKFTYKNWRGETSERKAIFNTLLYGSNEYHKEEQFMIFGFDLDKLSNRYYTLKDISNITRINSEGDNAYV